VGYVERNTWSGLIVTIAAFTVYIVVVLQQADGGSLERVDWVPIMLWTIGVSIIAVIILTILWGIVAGMRDPEASRTDVRDREIGRIGDRVGQAFTAMGGLGAIVLCALEADWFWIANTIFFGFGLSALVGGIATVVLYRRGMP
jgi:MFS family permease